MSLEYGAWNTALDVAASAVNEKIVEMETALKVLQALPAEASKSFKKQQAMLERILVVYKQTVQFFNDNQRTV